MSNGITLDAAGLIALDRNHRRTIVLLARATGQGQRITIPAAAFARAIRNPARQARLRRLVRQVNTHLMPLDGPDATAVGMLVARTGTADIVGAHVVICAQQTMQSVITSDPHDLERLAPN